MAANRKAKILYTSHFHITGCCALQVPAMPTSFLLNFSTPALHHCICFYLETRFWQRDAACTELTVISTEW